MTRTIICLLALAASAAAHAELLKPKGARATLTVTYEYKSAGKAGTAAGGTIEEWNALRIITVKAEYAADKPLPMSVMREPDAASKAKLAQQQAQTQALQNKMQPMANDMMAIAKSCGMSEDPMVSMTPAQEQAFEACVAKKVNTYADNMQVPADLKQTSAAISALGDQGGPRYQLWRLARLSGDYNIQEFSSLQAFEMTCTAIKVCKRTVVTEGRGAIPQPPGGKSIEGASMLEVDSVGKDLVVTLPVPLAALPIKTTVETSLPNDKSTSGPSVSKPLTSGKPITARIPANALTAEGNEVIRMQGTKMDQGTLTVTWKFTAE